MFDQKKRILALIAAVTLPILAALWSAVLSKLTSSQHPYIPYAYVGVITLISLSVAFYTHIRPARDLEKPILKLFGILAEGPLKLGTQAGIKPRINLMLVASRWYFFGRKRIRIVWGVNMENYPDVKFSCREDQGVVGRALRSGRPVMFDCQTEDKNSLGLNERQIEQTSHVTAIWSLPIYEVDSKGQQTGRIVGTLNFDSTAQGGFAKLQQSSTALEFDLVRLCDTIAQVL